MRAFALVLLTALPAAGQDFDPDFDRVFADHAAEVQSPTPGMEVLELPGPVVLTRQGGYVTAQDQSAWGPAGCALRRDEPSSSEDEAGSRSSIVSAWESRCLVQRGRRGRQRGT